MKTSCKPGSGLRWERRYGRTPSSQPLTTPILVRIVLLTRRTLWQVTVGLAVTFVVIGIALCDSSIRRFLEAMAVLAPGLGLAFGGYPQVGVPLVVIGVSVASWFLYCWCREDMIKTSYPATWILEEISARKIREPI